MQSALLTGILVPFQDNDTSQSKQNLQSSSMTFIQDLDYTKFVLMDKNFSCRLLYLVMVVKYLLMVRRIVADSALSMTSRKWLELHKVQNLLKIGMLVWGEVHAYYNGFVQLIDNGDQVGVHVSMNRWNFEDIFSLEALWKTFFLFLFVHDRKHWETNFFFYGYLKDYTPGAFGSTFWETWTTYMIQCKGEGHMSKQCTKPKRKRDDSWFKEKVLLVEAQALWCIGILQDLTCEGMSICESFRVGFVRGKHLPPSGISSSSDQRRPILHD
ncbi:hypothetical protein Tco_1070367 [Tanacetum coccineum]|uniref:Uncharacterized protein n=1 Tax=Tanacetum coccineum TaxID=301880 RepID=A0ABQ5HN38_9ASTR